MKRQELKDLQEYQGLSKEDMSKVMGGIDTVPLPEKPIYSIGTWPTPEKPFLSVARPSGLFFLK